MLSLVIVGFPRTATTVTYNLAVNIFPDSEGFLHLYEPFCYTAMKMIFELGFIFHDKEGIVHEDYRMLPADLAYNIYKNSRWILNWSQADTVAIPFLGNVYAILDKLDELSKRVIVKDVYLWTRLAELVEKYDKTIFVLLVRDKNSLIKDFLTYFEKAGLMYDLSRLLSQKEVVKKLLSPRMLIKTIKTGLTYLAERPTSRCGYFGIGLFYRYFYGELININELSLEEIAHIVDRVYSQYVKIVDNVSSSKNVVVIKYLDKVNVEQVGKILKNIKTKIS